MNAKSHHCVTQPGETASARLVGVISLFIGNEARGGLSWVERLTTVFVRTRCEQGRVVASRGDLGVYGGDR